jgi:hypothetical protein
MLRHARSTTAKPNPAFTKLPRAKGEDNLAWGRRAVTDMGIHIKTTLQAEWTCIALVGGADTLSFRLRVAQSHLRPDMLPSYWSDAILVQLAGESLDGAQAIHVPLAQPEGPVYAPKVNGVVTRPVKDFGDPALYPNIALIALPFAQAEMLRRVKIFRESRPTLDALEHVLRWLAYSWGVARTGNPLHDNYGVPSACMLETVCAAVGFDLTPGLESRASCPEAIWSAAMHWQEYYAKTVESAKIPFGRYAIDHGYPIVEPPPLPSEEPQDGVRS